MGKKDSSARPLSWLQGTRTNQMPEWISTNPKAFRLLYEFAERSRREEADIEYEGTLIHLNIREFICGRISTSKKVGITEQEYRTLYGRFVKLGYIQTIKSTNKFTIGKYLADGIFFNNQPSDQPPSYPAYEPPVNHQLTTNNNDKKEKNEVIHASPEGERERSVKKKKCPNIVDGHEGCKQYIVSFGEDRGVKFPNFAKQVNALHKMLSAGYTFGEIDRQVDLLEKDRFWSQRGFDLMNVANEIGKGARHA